MKAPMGLSPSEFHLGAVFRQVLKHRVRLWLGLDVDRLRPL